MSTSDRWSVKLSIVEIDGETHAEARLVREEDDHLSGRGEARLNPADREVTRIGEEIAVARALSDLAHTLLHTAAAGIEDITHKRVHLHL
jgi:Rv2632c-like